MKNTKKYRALEVLIYFTLLLISFFLQSTEIIFKYNSPAPSLILALVLVICFYENYLFSSIFGLFAGISIDSISTNGSGFHALIYMLTGFICSVVLESFFQNNFASFAVISVPVLIIHMFAEIISKVGFASGIFSLFFKFYLPVRLHHCNKCCRPLYKNPTGRIFRRPPPPLWEAPHSRGWHVAYYILPVGFSVLSKLFCCYEIYHLHKVFRIRPFYLF